MRGVMGTESWALYRRGLGHVFSGPQKNVAGGHSRMGIFEDFLELSEREISIPVPPACEREEGSLVLPQGPDGRSLLHSGR